MGGYFTPAEYTITFKKENFFEKTTVIKGKLDGWYIGNIFFGGLIGLLVVDPITGAMWRLPKIVSVSLDENNLSELNSNELKIVSINSISVKDRVNLIPLE